MQAIERFTKQDIPVQIVPGYMPEPGEKAEPIAMGRQTIWGGAGKPPSRDVMQAAAKAARTEMLQRVRENKASPGARGERTGAGARSTSKPAPDQHSTPPRQHRPQGEPGLRAAPGHAPHKHASAHAGSPRSAQNQPDPMRTSVDMMAERGARRNTGYRNGSSYAGSGGRSGGGAGGFGGGGNRSRGPRSSSGSFNR